MLLSFGKAAKASSRLDGLPPENAFDVRTYWSARTANQGEWLSVDLGKVCRIEAAQVNFAEHESTALAGAAELYHQYRLEGSLDAKTWETQADRSGNRRDVPHDYIKLPAPVNARFVQITNVRMPGGGSFSIRDYATAGSHRGAGGWCPGDSEGLTLHARRDRQTPRPEASGRRCRYCPSDTIVAWYRRLIARKVDGSGDESARR